MATKKVAKKRGRPRKNAESAVTEAALRAAVKEARVPLKESERARILERAEQVKEEIRREVQAGGSVGDVILRRYVPNEVSSLTALSGDCLAASAPKAVDIRRDAATPAGPTISGELNRLVLIVNNLNDALGVLRDRIVGITEPFQMQPEPDRTNLGCVMLDDVSTQCERLVGLTICVHNLTDAIRL